LWFRAYAAVAPAAAVFVFRSSTILAVHVPKDTSDHVQTTASGCYILDRVAVLVVVVGGGAAAAKGRG